MRAKLLFGTDLGRKAIAGESGRGDIERRTANTRHEDREGDEMTLLFLAVACLSQVADVPRSQTPEEAEAAVSFIERDLEELKEAKVGKNPKPKKLGGPIYFPTAQAKNAAVKRQEQLVTDAKKYHAFLKNGGDPEEFQWMTIREAKAKLSDMENTLREWATARVQPGRGGTEVNVETGVTRRVFSSESEKRESIKAMRAGLLEQQLLIRKIEATPDSAKR